MTGINQKVFLRALSWLWDRGNHQRIDGDMAKWSLWQDDPTPNGIHYVWPPHLSKHAMTWLCVPYVMTQLASAGSQPVSSVFFRHQGALTPDIRWLGLSLAPPNVIHGITTLPGSILSTHPMGDCSHVVLIQALSFKSGTRVLVNPFVSFQHSQYMLWPSHLLWYNILLATDSSLFGIASQTQYLYRPSDLVSRIHIAFTQDGTKLLYCPPDFGLRIWDIAGLTDEHRHSAHGYELKLQDMTDGRIMGWDNWLLFPSDSLASSSLLNTLTVTLGPWEVCRSDSAEIVPNSELLCARSSSAEHLFLSIFLQDSASGVWEYTVLSELRWMEHGLTRFYLLVLLCRCL